MWGSNRNKKVIEWYRVTNTQDSAQLLHTSDGRSSLSVIDFSADGFENRIEVTQQNNPQLQRIILREGPGSRTDCKD